LNKDDLVKLAFNNEPNKSIGDQIALAIGNLGENMTLRRAVLVKLEKGQHLAWYMHGSCLYFMRIFLIK
jgi:translation elongation factor EF-Ts